MKSCKYKQSRNKSIAIEINQALNESQELWFSIWSFPQHFFSPFFFYTPFPFCTKHFFLTSVWWSGLLPLGTTIVFSPFIIVQEAQSGNPNGGQPVTVANHLCSGPKRIQLQFHRWFRAAHACGRSLMFPAPAVIWTFGSGHSVAQGHQDAWHMCAQSGPFHATSGAFTCDRPLCDLSFTATSS